MRRFGSGIDHGPTRLAPANLWMTGVLLIATTAVAFADDVTFSRGRRFDERSGEALYRSVCQGCHMPDGRGARGAGAYPALAGDGNLASPQYPIIVMLAGRRNMPSFAKSLDDAQIAAVATYVRSHFGNAYADDVTAQQVADLRAIR